MIKTTVKHIYDAIPVLQKLIDKPLPVRISYPLSKLVSEINNEISICNIERDKILKEYGETEDGKHYIVKGETGNKELKDLYSQEVELNAKTVKLTDDIILTVNEIMAISDYIEVISDEE